MVKLKLLTFAFIMNLANAKDVDDARIDLYKKQSDTPGFYVRTQVTKGIGDLSLDEIRTFVLVLKILCSGDSNYPWDQTPVVNSLEANITPIFLNKEESKPIKETTSQGFLRVNWSGKKSSEIKSFQISIQSFKFYVDADAGPFVLTVPNSLCAHNIK